MSKIKFRVKSFKGKMLITDGVKVKVKVPKYKFSKVSKNVL